MLCTNVLCFQCHDPPLEDVDIPEGDWICIRCFTSKPENQKLIEKARLKSPVKKDPKAAVKVHDDKVSDKVVVDQVKPDKEWRPGGKGKKVEVAKPVRATR